MKKTVYPVVYGLVEFDTDGGGHDMCMVRAITANGLESARAMWLDSLLNRDFCLAKRRSDWSDWHLGVLSLKDGPPSAAELEHANEQAAVVRKLLNYDNLKELNDRFDEFCQSLTVKAKWEGEFRPNYGGQDLAIYYFQVRDGALCNPHHIFSYLVDLVDGPRPEIDPDDDEEDYLREYSLYWLDENDFRYKLSDIGYRLGEEQLYPDPDADLDSVSEQALGADE